jgi:quercetin dioxygenase-like cupin family protein
MPEPTFKHEHYTRIKADEFGAGAPGVTIRQLIDEESDGAPYYNLRMIEIAPGGHTPEHAHDNEHENFVLEGAGEVLYDGMFHPVGPGDVIFIPPSSVHQYRNAGEGTFRFLCGVPVPRIMGT